MVRDGRVVRALGGGAVISSTAVGCDGEALRAANREALIRLAKKIAPPSRSTGNGATETVTGALGGEPEGSGRDGAPCLWVETAQGRVQLLIDVDAIKQIPGWTTDGSFEGIRASPVEGQVADLVVSAGDSVIVMGTRAKADRGCGEFAIVPTAPIARAS